MDEDVALIIGNQNYVRDRVIRSADEVLGLGLELEDLGFRVIAGEEITAEALRNLIGQFEAQADGSGRLVIALTGHFSQPAKAGSWRQMQIGQGLGRLGRWGYRAGAGRSNPGAGSRRARS